MGKSCDSLTSEGVQRDVLNYLQKYIPLHLPVYLLKMRNDQGQQSTSQPSPSLKKPNAPKRKTVVFDIEETDSRLNRKSSFTKSNKKNINKERHPRKDSHVKNPFGGSNNFSQVTTLPVAFVSKPNYSTLEKDKEAAKDQPNKKHITKKSKGIDSFTNTEPRVLRKRLAKPLVNGTSQGTATEADITNDSTPKEGFQTQLHYNDTNYSLPSESHGTQTDAALTNYRSKQSREQSRDGVESQCKMNHKTREMQYKNPNTSLSSESRGTQTDLYLTNFKPKRSTNKYSNDGGYRAVQIQPNKIESKHPCHLHPEDKAYSAKMYPKSEQTQYEKKKKRPSSNDVDGIKVNEEKRRHATEQNPVERRLICKQYSQIPQQEYEYIYPSRWTYADGDEPRNGVEVMIPSERNSVEEGRYPKHMTLTSDKPKRRERSYSKDGDVMKDSYGPGQNKPNKNGNKHSHRLHPGDEYFSATLSPKLEQSQHERKKRRSSSNKSDVKRKRVSEEKKQRQMEQNLDDRRLIRKSYSQSPKRTHADGSDLSSYFEIFIPCELNLDEKNYTTKQSGKSYFENDDFTKKSYVPLHNKPKTENNHSSQLNPKDNTYSAILYPKFEQGVNHRKGRSSSNKNDVGRKGVSDENKHPSFDPNHKRKLSEQRYSQGGKQQSADLYNTRDSYADGSKLFSDVETFIPSEQHLGERKISQKKHPNVSYYKGPVEPKTKTKRYSDVENLPLEKKNYAILHSEPKRMDKRNKNRSRRSHSSHPGHRPGASTKSNRRDSNPPLDREALKAKLENIIGEQAKEVKEKEKKRAELLKMLKEAAKKKKSEVDPIRYSHSNSNPPLDREALKAKLEDIIGEQAKEIQKRDAMLNPKGKPFIPYNPQRRPGGDADNRPRREAEDVDYPKPTPHNVWAKAPRTKTHAQGMKRYHIQIPDKGSKETPFNVRFNLNDEQSVDMTYNGPVKINNYFSTTKYY